MSNIVLVNDMTNGFRINWDTCEPYAFGYYAPTYSKSIVIYRGKYSSIDNLYVYKPHNIERLLYLLRTYRDSQDHSGTLYMQQTKNRAETCRWNNYSGKLI